MVPHPLNYAGESFDQKLANLRENLTEINFDAMVVTEQDEIAWLFNLRGEGRTTNTELMISPLFDSVALITKNLVKLWLKKESLSQTIALRDVEILEYDKAIDDLRTWAMSITKTTAVLVPKRSIYLKGAPYSVYSALKTDNTDLKF